MRDIYLEHPDVVCVSCYIWNLSFVKELMADLIKILPGADFWAGGPEVSYDAETNTTPCASKSAFTFSISLIPRLQGPHHVAQKSTNTTLPG